MGQNLWKCDNNTPFFLVESKEWVLIYILTLLFFQKIFFVGPKKGKYGKKSGNWENMKNCWNSPEDGESLGMRGGWVLNTFYIPYFPYCVFFEVRDRDRDMLIDPNTGWLGGTVYMILTLQTNMNSLFKYINQLNIITSHIISTNTHVNSNNESHYCQINHHMI